MNYVTGKVIKELRKKHGFTQKELAEKINVSNKTVSKWETAKGFPDIVLIEDLAKVLGVSIAELLTGEFCRNENQSANLKKMSFFVCPVCGNIITAVGEGSFSCCGVMLPSLEAEKCDEEHMIKVEETDGEYYITMDHPMDKKHYISFIAYVNMNRCEMVKLYPEQEVSVRIARRGRGFIYAYCNRHGFFRTLI